MPLSELPADQPPHLQEFRPDTISKKRNADCRVVQNDNALRLMFRPGLHHAVLTMTCQCFWLKMPDAPFAAVAFEISRVAKAFASSRVETSVMCWEINASRISEQIDRPNAVVNVESFPADQVEQFLDVVIILIILCHKTRICSLAQFSVRIINAIAISVSTEDN